MMPMHRFFLSFSCASSLRGVTPVALAVLVSGCMCGCGSPSSSSSASSSEAPSNSSAPAPPSPTPGTALGQMPPKLQTETYENGYKSAPEFKAVDLAKQADASVAAMKDAGAEVEIHVEFPEGRGNSNG